MSIRIKRTWHISSVRFLSSCCHRKSALLFCLLLFTCSPMVSLQSSTACRSIKIRTLKLNERLLAETKVGQAESYRFRRKLKKDVRNMRNTREERRSRSWWQATEKHTCQYAVTLAQVSKHCCKLYVTFSRDLRCCSSRCCGSTGSLKVCTQRDVAKVHALCRVRRVTPGPGLGTAT